MPRALRYAIDEAVASLWRGRQAALLSTLTSAVALFVLGGVLIATANLQRMADEWSQTAELSVYLNDEATPTEVAAVAQLLQPGDVVVTYDFVSKAQALERFKRTFSDLAATVDSVNGNPLPASYEVRLQPSKRTGPAVEELAKRLSATPGVADVRYDRQWLDRLLSTIGALRTAGLALSAFLVVAAALTVANVVRLALFARRDEIEIMQLIGAPTVFVRGPFVVEGLLQGGLGALVALLFLGIAFAVVRGRYLSALGGALNLSAVGFLSLGTCVLLLLGGMLVGSIGGFIASRQA